MPADAMTGARSRCSTRWASRSPARAKTRRASSKRCWPRPPPGPACLRRQPPRRPSRCRADQRHRRARARFRQRHQHHVRPRLGDHGAGADRRGRSLRRQRTRSAARRMSPVSKTGARLGRGLNMHHYEKGWHPTSTLGVFAVAAACAHLLNLTNDETETALAMATSLAARHQGQFRHHDQAAARRPVRARRTDGGAARAQGLYREPRRVRAQAGLLQRVQRRGQLTTRQKHPRQAGASRSTSSRRARATKQYPCCASTHAAVDAALEHRAAASVRSIRTKSRASNRGRRRSASPTPTGRSRKSALDAKFSVQYCVARALLDGRVVFADLEGDAYREPRVHALLARTHAMPFTEGAFAVRQSCRRRSESHARRRPRVYRRRSPNRSAALRPIRSRTPRCWPSSRAVPRARCLRRR